MSTWLTCLCGFFNTQVKGIAIWESTTLYCALNYVFVLINDEQRLRFYCKGSFCHEWNIARR